MNRGVLVGVIFLYFILIAYMGSILGVTATDIIDCDLAFAEVGTDITVWSLLGTFFAMLSFNVDIPIVINLFLIYPPLIILIWQIVEILKDLVPLT